MAYDATLAARITEVLLARRQISQKRMFGGVAWMHAGHMFCGVIGARLAVRVGAEAYAAALSRPGVAPMDFTGRPLQGYVYVAPEAITKDVDLSYWIDRGLAYVTSLPPKEASTN